MTNSRHTLSVLVENKPGVLTRFTGLIARRGFNIHSLAVGVTEHEELSRITVVVDVNDVPLEQVTKQLNKLVEVLKVVELDPLTSVTSQVVLVKVRAEAGNRSGILETAQMFKAKIVDTTPDAMILQVYGNSDKIAAMLEILQPYGVRELVQSGVVAIGRGPRSITDRSRH